MPSQDLNENQAENTQYGVVSYLHTTDRFTGQVSLFARYSTLTFTPDAVGDILYNGISQRRDQDRHGRRGAGRRRLSPRTTQHTLRGGVIVEIDRSTSDTTSQVMLRRQQPSRPDVRPADRRPAVHHRRQRLEDRRDLQRLPPGRVEAAPQPDAQLWRSFRPVRRIPQREPGQPAGQPGLAADAINDDPRRLRALFLAAAVRADRQRVGAEVRRALRRKPRHHHERKPNRCVLRLARGDNVLPLVTKDTTPFAERANYFDVGAEQKVGPDLTLTIDSYDKLSTHLVDEGQFGAPIILTPFNYADGIQYGIELTAAYNHGPLSAYANLAYSVARGRDWISSQFNFPQAEIDYVANHYIYLDHDERVAVSAGASYLWQGTRFGGDLIYGSGLRASQHLATPVVEPDGSVLTDVPNGAELPGYTQVNLSVSHRFDDAPGGPIEVRFDVINAFDEVYQIRNGTGVGVFAPQFGPRRGFFVGFTKDFG